MSAESKGFDLQPTLAGHRLHLRPLRKEDFEELYQAASDPLIWEQHPMSHRYQRDSFKEYFESALQSGGALVVKDTMSGQMIGCSRYYNLDLQKSVVMIGYTFLTRDFWGGKFNQEMKNLMLEHAFEFVDEVQFEVDSKNIRSQKGTSKIGAQHIGQNEKINPDQSKRIVFIYSIKKEKDRF